MDTKEILKKVRKIEIKTKRLSDHIFSGEYHTSFKGRGMTFSEVRQYQYGDDVRSIDWNVTAKNNDTYVKVFEEERELTMLLLVDCSGSLSFGTQNIQKKELITEIAATLAFSATNNNDKIGLLLFSDQIELFIPPKKGKYHVLRIIRELLEFTPKSTNTDIEKALQFLGQVQKKKAIVFLISDFMHQNYDKALVLAAKKHDITGVRVYDKIEEELPKLGFIQINDLETNKRQYVNSNAKKVRAEYASFYQDNTNYFSKSFTKSGSGIIQTATHENFVTKLWSYFKARS